MATKYNVLNLPRMCVHYLEVLKAIQCKRFLCGSLCVFWDNPYHMYSVCIRIYSTYVHIHVHVCVLALSYSNIPVGGTHGEV